MTTSTTRAVRRITSCITCLSIAFVLGCAGQTRNVQPAGFLEDYSVLKEREDTPRLYYVHPTADFNKYDKLMFDPVTVWATEENDLSEVPRKDLDRLCNMLYTTLKKDIEKRGHRKIVTTPGPGVIRCRLAITEASSASKMNLVATILPQMSIVGEGVGLATGTRGFVGKASIEGVARDSLTGELLVAGVDRRQGGRDLGTGWSHVEDALKVWAEQIGKDFGGGDPRR
jgi:hypothetical protein